MYKQLFFVIALTLFAVTATPQIAQAQTEYKVVTVVESIVPGGAGRSRIIDNKTDLNVKDVTTDRVDGKSWQGEVSRKDAKVYQFSESKLLNFYSLTGINFQNIASNDALISSKLTEMSKEGWELMFVTSGVESDSGEYDGKGIYVTRFVFKK